MTSNSLVASMVIAALLIAAVILAVGRMQGDEPATRAADDASAPSSAGPWLNEIDSALKNSATAEETFAVTAGTYTSNVADLVDQGLRLPGTVTIRVARATATGYCMEATHALAAGQVFHYSSDVGRPTEGAC
ncbi:MAG: hypothetical protein ACRDJ2_09095 [Actinomycetota bacterium]